MMFYTKVLPDIFDFGAVAASIILSDPRWLIGVGIGEVWRIYNDNLYKGQKVHLKQEIMSLEKSIENRI